MVNASIMLDFNKNEEFINNSWKTKEKTKQSINQETLQDEKESYVKLAWLFKKTSDNVAFLLIFTS